MKWLKVFSVFVLMHVIMWGGAHIYRSMNPTPVIVGVDTSFNLKPYFPAMQQWIEQYESSTRYESILVVTDKSEIGPLDSIQSKQSIFRTAFGRSSADDFSQYESTKAKKRVLLSDGSISPDGWDVIQFN